MIFKDAGTVMPVWRVSRVDPGFIYVIESHGRYKIGKTRQTASRLRAAKTWLPDMTLIGCKPFWGISYHERQLHAGFASYWYAREWFNFEDDIDARDILIDGVTAFSDDSPDRNSVDFICWFNGDGMAEFQVEMHRRRLSLPAFQKEESLTQKTAGKP